VYRLVIVPGVTGAVVMGVLLFASVWRAMVRMRWFVVKAGLIMVGVPTLHVVLSSRVDRLGQVVCHEGEAGVRMTLEGQILAGTAAALTFGIIVAWLGRIKPRLGQDFGRTFAGKKEGGPGC
jgi:hypothetical protein